MTDEEVFALLKQQEEIVSKKVKFYVHYESSSKNVISLRNYLDTTDSLPYIELSEEEIGVPLDKFNVTQYKVAITDGKGKLEKNAIFENTITTIDQFIYEIPKTMSANGQKFDLLIEQNNPKGQFRIKLSQELREKISLQRQNSHVQCLYVTAVNDPNILYKTLRFTLADLISREFHVLPFEDFQGNDVNIYGLKYFENYLHVDIR